MDVLFEEWNLQLENSNKLRSTQEEIGPWSQVSYPPKFQKDQPPRKQRQNMIIRRRPKSRKQVSGFTAKEGTFTLNDLSNQPVGLQTSVFEDNLIQRMKCSSLPIKKQILKAPLKETLKLMNLAKKSQSKVRFQRLLSRNQMVGNRIQQRKKLRLSHEGIRYPRLPVGNLAGIHALQIRALRPKVDMFNRTAGSLPQCKLKEE